MTAAAPRESIFDVLTRTGQIDRAIEAICGPAEKEDHKRFMYRCPSHGLGDGKDSNASLYVFRETGSWGCVCGAEKRVGGGLLLTLGVHYGIGATPADVAKWLDERFGGAALTGGNGHGAAAAVDPAPAPRVAPTEFPYYPKTAEALGFELTTNPMVRCSKCRAVCTTKLLRIPTTYPGEGKAPDRWRGPRHDCEPKSMFVAGSPNAVVHGLVNWSSVLAAVQGAPDGTPTVFLTAGETDLLAFVFHAVDEGLFDGPAAVPVFCAATGEKSALPKMGKPSHLESALETLRHVRLVVLGDNDEPGRLAAGGLVEWCAERDVDSVAVFPPLGKDVREFLGSHGSVRDLVRLSEPPPAPAAPAAVTTPDGLEIHLTDTGNALLFQRDHGRDLRYVAAKSQWYTWTGAGIWAPDETGAVVRRAMATLRAAQAAALQLPSKKDRKSAYTHYLKSEGEPSIRRMLKLAESLSGIAATLADFDRDPNLLCCQNGVIDLRSAVLQPHDRELMQTRSSPVGYDPAARCPRFLRFMSEVCLGETVLVDWIRRAIGYSATGDIREHCSFFLLGTGANGKSVLLETIRHVLGDYATATDIETFVARDVAGGPTNDVARLPGARCVVSSEPEEGAYLAESRLKALTGGDTVSARFLYNEFFEFKPQFKLWISTNNRPRVRGTDEGIWRRIRLIPFRAAFLGDSADQTLPSTLRGEAPGILSWVVQAAVDWHERGLGPCPLVDGATKEYRSEQDVFGQFLDERCEIGFGPAFSVASADLYRAYRSWCEEQGERPWSMRAISRHLQSKNYSCSKRKGGRMIWDGLRLDDGTKDPSFDAFNPL